MMPFAVMVASEANANEEFMLAVCAARPRTQTLRQPIAASAVITPRRFDTPHAEKYAATLFFRLLLIFASYYC